MLEIMNNYLTVLTEKNSENFQKNKSNLGNESNKSTESNESTESNKSKNYNSFKQTVIDLFCIIIPSGIVYSIIFCIIFLV